MHMENVHRQPAHPSIDEGMVKMLIQRFHKIRGDSEIGPIFARAIGDDWDGHLVKMCDSRSSIMLMSGRYNASPMIVHMRLKAIQPQHFERRPILFRLTAEEVRPMKLPYCSLAALKTSRVVATRDASSDQIRTNREFRERTSS